MADVVGIVGPGGEGGTFLDWTIHYLIGDTFFKIVLVDRPTNTLLNVIDYPVLDNPVTKNGDAHNHKKTHPTETTVQACVDLLQTIETDKSKLHTMYIVPSSNEFDKFLSYRKFVETLVESSTGLKFIQMYHPDEMLEDLVYRMYNKIPDNIGTFEELRTRVQLACNDTNKVMVQPNVYSLNIKDMFYNLDQEIYKIMSWLNFSVDPEKYKKWLVVYKSWQNAQDFKFN